MCFCCHLAGSRTAFLCVQMCRSPRIGGRGLAISIWGADRRGEIYTLTAQGYSLWLKKLLFFGIKVLICVTLLGNLGYIIYICTVIGNYIFIIVMGKRDTVGDYTVIDLGDKLPGDDLEECMKMRCTNKLMLERMTGIPYNRLVYLFAKKRRSYLVEAGYIIIRTTVVYKGRQPGGIRNKNLFVRGNNNF